MENNEKLDNILSEIRGIKTHIENVTDKNIETIAEGHLDLSRKLDNALKVENEKELLIIRVRMLEDEIRKIKEKLEKNSIKVNYYTLKVQSLFRIKALHLFWYEKHNFMHLVPVTIIISFLKLEVML